MDTDCANGQTCWTGQTGGGPGGGTGLSICTTMCQMDSDCDLMGFTDECLNPTGDGVITDYCIPACDPDNGDADCPQGMACYGVFQSDEGTCLWEAP